jgi:hypothetical protein
MMRVFAAILALLAFSSSASSQRKPKPPEVQVVETAARRSEGKILLDGRVRITAEKPVRGLVVVFDFLSPEKGVLTSEKATLEEEPLAQGEERAYHSETAEPPRAVRYQIRAFDHAEKELRVGNSGPFSIE